MTIYISPKKQDANKKTFAPYYYLYAFPLTENNIQKLRQIALCIKSPKMREEEGKIPYYCFSGKKKKAKAIAMGAIAASRAIEMKAFKSYCKVLEF